MNESDQRTGSTRKTDVADGAYALAVLYTIGYLGMVGALMFFNIPENNRELLIGLVGIMSAAQLGIIKYYYDGSKGAEQSQAANIARSARTDSVVQEIAKAAAPVAAAAVAAATGQPVAPTEPTAASPTKEIP